MLADTVVSLPFKCSLFG